MCRPYMVAPVVADAVAGELRWMYASGNIVCLPVHCMPMDLGMAALCDALLLVLLLVERGSTCPRWPRRCLGGYALEVSC